MEEKICKTTFVAANKAMCRKAGEDTKNLKLYQGWKWTYDWDG